MITTRAAKKHLILFICLFSDTQGTNMIYISITLVIQSKKNHLIHGIMAPNLKCCRMGNLDNTSCLYIFSIPFATLLHDSACEAE